MADSGARPRNLGLPEYVTRRPGGFYRSVNPSTKLAVAALEVVAAFLIPGWFSLAILAVVLGTAGAARRSRAMGTIALATSPIVGSILLVNLFLLPGATDPILRLGPLAPTWSGLWFGLQTVVRLLAFSTAIALVYLTTPIDDLLADLAHRGLGRRAVFVVGAAVQTVPRTIERAAEIVDAQRARGMDTAAPLIFGALTEVEERTIALEARGFSAPVRQTLMRAPADRVSDRAIRWLALASLFVLVVLRITGRLG